MEVATTERLGAKGLLRHQLWIALAAGVVFFTGLGASRLWDEDETEYARCAREMLVRGDWVVPSWNYRMWVEKPACYYWLVAGSFKLFGMNEFAARFPSALLALATALLTYHLGRLLFRPEVGLWAALVLVTNLMFAVIARAATLDSTLIFCTTLTLLAYVSAVRRRSGREQGAWGLERGAGGGERRATALDDYTNLLPQSRWDWLAMYAPMGLAMLVKGPVGVLLPAAGIGLFLVLSQPGPAGPLEAIPPKGRGQRVRGAVRAAWQCLAHYGAKVPAAARAMRPLRLTAIVLAIAGPWYVWVTIRTGGEWPWSFFWQHNIERFAQPMQGHRGPFFYYALAIFLGFFPWSPFLIAGAAAMVRRIRRGEAQGPACLLALAWSAVWIGIFSLAGTKLPHYVAPACPMLAVMAGLWLADWIAAPNRQPASWWLGASWGALALIGAGVGIALTWVAPHWLPGQPNHGWIGGILIVGAAFGWLMQLKRRMAAAVGSLVWTACAFFTCLLGIAAVPISQQQSGYLAANAIRQAGLEPTQVGMLRWAPQGFVYYCDRGEQVVYFWQASAALRFLKTTENPALLVDADGLRMIEPRLPPGIEVIDRRPRFLKPGEVILLGRRPTPADSGPTTADASAEVRSR